MPKVTSSILWIGGFVLEGYIPRRPKNFTNQLFPKGNESIFFTRKSFVVHKATLVVAHVFMTVFLIQNATRDTSGLFYSLMVLVVFVLFDLAYISNLRHGIRRMLT